MPNYTLNQSPDAWREAAIADAEDDYECEVAENRRCCPKWMLEDELNALDTAHEKRLERIEQEYRERLVEQAEWTREDD